MSDWLDAAQGRFEFLRRVAELRGCTVRTHSAGHSRSASRGSLTKTQVNGCSRRLYKAREIRAGPGTRERPRTCVLGHSEGPILAGLHYKQHSMALRRGFDTVGELEQSNMGMFCLRVNRRA